MNENLSKQDIFFERARELLDQDRAHLGVEQQVTWSMELQKAAVAILEKADFQVWGARKANLDIAADLARALSEIHFSEQLARLLAAGVAVHAEPGSDQEKESIALFEKLTIPSFEPARQVAVARDCVNVLSNVHAYYNGAKKEGESAKIPGPGEHGFNLRAAALARLFDGALWDDPENLIESYAVIAETSPADSAERLAAVVGLLRYPQYAAFQDGLGAEEYIRKLASVGSEIRDEAEEMLKTDATTPLKELLDRAKEKKSKG